MTRPTRINENRRMTQNWASLQLRRSKAIFQGSGYSFKLISNIIMLIFNYLYLIVGEDLS